MTAPENAEVELPEPFRLDSPEDVHDFMVNQYGMVRFEHGIPEGAFGPEKYGDGDTYTLTAHDIASVFRWHDLYTAERVRQAVLMERERIASQAAAMIAKWDEPYQRAGDLIVDAIRGFREVPQMSAQRIALHAGMRESGQFTVEAAAAAIRGVKPQKE